MPAAKHIPRNALTLVLLLPGAALALPFSNLYVLGDSLLDSGNAYAITGGFYPVSGPNLYDQRFSNGPVASEVLASDLGLQAKPSQTGGTNYATGGATSGFANFSGAVYSQPPVPPSLAARIALLSFSSTAGLTQQIGLLTTAPPADIGSSLVLIWAGANDLFLTSALVAKGVLPADPSTFISAADTAANNVESAINALAGAGAKNILAVNLPDLGEIPAADTPLASFLWSLYSNEFNAQFLDTGFLSGLDPSVKLTEFNMFDLFKDVMKQPSNYGFTNVTTACLPTSGPVPVGPACPDPDQHLFWDSAHPTTAADQIIGKLFFQAVPEPSSIALLIISFGMLIARRKPS